ncbi:MAG: NAD(P)(+) transhydrogenase (Re/Si-specific) subunit beta [Cyclobacteriaceae bacterium]
MSFIDPIFFELGYLLCIYFFIIGLKRLSHPETAKNGNRLAALGMGLAMLIALFQPLDISYGNYLWIIGGVGLGSSIGLLAAKKVKLTSMPELVSLFNGFGGAASMLIALVELLRYPTGASLLSGELLVIFFALFIGGISFTGSLAAWAKLEGRLQDSVQLPGSSYINIVLLLTTLGLMGYMMTLPELDYHYVLILLAISLVYGLTFVTPIGGGDMPVVISLLNSFTGVAAAFAGLIYGNQVMVVGGILVGASGTFLTVLMCDAMNRSLLNVIIGGFGSTGSGASGMSREEVVKEATFADLAIQLKYSDKVIIVPGYGLAVAQAQHVCHELETVLENGSVEVKYAIHPVAGRMPGHMNVLLAEADVAYPKLLELEDANKEFPSTDIVLVVGANDVVNPAAKLDPSSTIYGMPILDVEQARNIIILKRSMSAGYAGIQNQLFFGEKSRMLFGDAKSSISKLVEEIGRA